MQRQLRRLRYRCHQKEESDGGYERGLGGPYGREHRIKLGRSGMDYKEQRAEDEPDLADDVHHEGLHGGCGGLGA